MTGGDGFGFCMQRWVYLNVAQKNVKKMKSSDFIIDLLQR